MRGAGAPWRSACVLVVLVVLLGLLAPAGATEAAGPTTLAAAELDPMLQQYATLVHATYADALAAAQRLQQRLQGLTRAPSVQTLAAAREAWLAARERYALTEAFRFYGGPIDGAGGPELRLNTWPVDETYLDGLIAQRRLALTKASLSALNLRGGEENVATGWHAIEYLLWGRDTNPDGPGDRPHSDYLDGHAPDADRRRACLLTLGELLVDDLAGLEAAWAPARANYRRQFERSGPEALRRIVVGLGSLSRAELAGERLEVPLASRDQEDEQSCFSDSTHRDIVGDVQGIRNVWLGEYMSVDGRVLRGASLRALVAARDAALAERLTQQIDASLAAANAIQPPFDREILGGSDAPGRLRVRHVIDALVTQTATLAEAARRLGIVQLHWVRAP